MVWAKTHREPAVVAVASVMWHLSESAPMCFTHSCAHDANVGTGTEVRLEFENDTDKIILNSDDGIRLYANFVDQLDCDADSTDTNLLDLDDLDIF
eukprot:scaffold1422_cov48-Attheya_sp.AAC.5